MPELPEVEVLRRSLEPRILGDRITRVEVRNSAMREPVSRASLAKRTVGRKIIGLHRRAKYLLIDLEGDQTLVVHLGMSGRLTVVPEAEPLEPHEHVAFFLESGRRLRLRDPRRFGLVFAVRTSEIPSDPHFSHLG
ncbi:MAG TPA: DNA-formamidopyrimidine glycosylase family protein, partial [Thermoanaerobaculia bacterium]|nr:DNA-formamidopyrimidine glycosylase family protein [Thermoanaerobaculia bacterium]